MSELDIIFCRTCSDVIDNGRCSCDFQQVCEECGGHPDVCGHMDGYDEWLDGAIDWERER